MHSERRAEGAGPVAFGAYVTSADFAVDVTENRQSECLRFFPYVFATVWLVQRGSPESKPAARTGTGSRREQRVGRYAPPGAPRWAGAGGWREAVYSRSPGLAMGGLFALSWLAQSASGPGPLFRIPDLRGATTLPQPGGWEVPPPYELRSGALPAHGGTSWAPEGPGGARPRGLILPRTGVREVPPRSGRQALTAYNDEQRLRRRDTDDWGQYVTSAEFWSRTLQNWQSEFLAIASMAVLSVHLRQRGSPESKPVGAPHREHA
ncbi:DUF6766 family protein [Streptomyces sp. URMC 129]|uniref:DUF6766 family protein n=1 Tax=Streptomyces sp. URMC 129 TaxID=3423407 RepID=UPI003F1D0B87